MTQRFNICRGRNTSGSVNYGVQDSMPGAGSDGRLADYSNEGEALEHVARLNAAFAAEARGKATQGLEWVWNGRCFSWDRPLTIRGAYCD